MNRVDNLLGIIYSSINTSISKLGYPPQTAAREVIGELDLYGRMVGLWGQGRPLHMYMYCILWLRVDPKFKVTAAAKAQPGKAQPGRPGNEHLDTSGRIACSRDSEIGVYSRSADVSTPLLAPLLVTKPSSPNIQSCRTCYLPACCGGGPIQSTGKAEGLAHPSLQRAVFARAAGS